jgi:hypothetical protein
VGEVVWLWFHALKAHDWVGRREMMIGVGTRQRRSLAGTECGHRPDRVRGLRLRADGIDVLEHASRGTGMDDASFHGDKFVGGATEFLLSKSEVVECGGVVVKEGTVAGDFSSYTRVA